MAQVSTHVLLLLQEGRGLHKGSYSLGYSLDPTIPELIVVASQPPWDSFDTRVDLVNVHQERGQCDVKFPS